MSINERNRFSPISTHGHLYIYPSDLDSSAQQPEESLFSINNRSSRRPSESYAKVSINESNRFSPISTQGLEYIYLGP